MTTDRPVLAGRPELAPDQMFAQLILGYALSSDVFGRPNRHLTDRRGAIDAYRRAKTLEPENLTIRRNLAMLLEQNDEGKRYAEGADLDAAATEYREVIEDLDDRSLAFGLIMILMRQGKFDEAETVAKATPAASGRDGYLAAAVAHQRGAGAAVQALREANVSAEDQEKALTEARALLVLLRHYRQAADVASATAGTDTFRSLAAVETLQQVERYEEVIAEAAGPEAPVQKTFVATMLAKDPVARMAELRSSRSLAEEARRRESLQGPVAVVLRDVFLRARVFEPGMPIEKHEDDTWHLVQRRLEKL